MNPQAFDTLEFSALRALVRRGAQTDLGRGRLASLAPADDLRQLQRALLAVGENIELRHRGSRLSFDGVADPTESIARLKIQGTALEPLALLDLARLCERAMDARAAILSEREQAPTLFEIVGDVPGELKKLAALLQRKILPGGELDDRASPELARIRRELTSARSRITRSLEGVMRRSSEAIQEELVTVRNDRFVIPVRADHRSRINGVAHGSSSSGQTIFVEPLETIEANNELQSLREDEQREIAEILFALSEDLRRDLPAIERAAEAITELDFINAKAVFAERFDCVVPVIEGGTSAAAKRKDLNENDDRLEPGLVPADLEFVAARHPLLQENLRATGGAVVPVSFKLDNENTTMVISGANAGGKTVVLKTAGLLSLMALSGLPVPAKQAQVPFYRSVLADIGDHQSLAANLSTFTSHVANIGSMIEACEAPALVLLDEVGTGTDPEEGSALGVAVVDHFKQRGAHVLATTHYSGLKIYAANSADVLNASVEFDEQTLRPTYRLLVGIAGSSSGLEIAQRFGIPAAVIARAMEQVKGSSRDSIEYLRRIKREAEEAETQRKALEEERIAVAEKFAAIDEEAAKQEAARQAELQKELSRTVKEFEEHSRRLTAKIEDRASRLKLDREAARRTAELKREAQRVAEIPIKTERGHRPSSSQDSTPQLRGVRVIRDGQIVSDLPADSDDAKPSQEPDERAVRQNIRGPLRDLKIGDRVRLLSFGSVGVVNHIRDDEAEVRVGSLRMREKLVNLELVFEVGTSSGKASDRRDEVSTARVSGRVKPSLEDTRRRAQTTELHLHSGSSDGATSAELKLIGKKTDEAAELTDKFLDEAFLNGLTEVRIIHGHGTGALRRAIAAMLTGHPHVARFAPAPQDHGGGGATIVELKQ
ncbi:MAG: mismatch repair protein MutS2 [Blastocatellia bacterium]|jgi:DNA mismatch repair protein MutS2|nr:mismatch repair protein MutS2 [Blastocatellia bacterium]